MITNLRAEYLVRDPGNIKFDEVREIARDLIAIRAAADAVLVWYDFDDHPSMFVDPIEVLRAAMPSEEPT